MKEENGDSKKNILDKSLAKGILSYSCGLVPAATVIFWLFRDKLESGIIGGFLLGAVTGLLNLYFLKTLIVATINPNGPNARGALIGFLGINATLAALIIPAYMQLVNAAGIAAGFTLILVIMFGVAFSAYGKIN